MSIIVIELSPLETSVLNELAAELDMDKVKVMHHALALYQHVHLRQGQGHMLAFVNEHGKIVPPEVFGCPALE